MHHNYKTPEKTSLKLLMSGITSEDFARDEQLSSIKNINERLTLPGNYKRFDSEMCFLL